MKFHPRIDLATLAPGAPVLIVCMLETELAEPSTDDRRVCASCLRVVRIAPSSQSFLADAERMGRTTAVRCMYCARSAIERPGMEFGLAPGSIEEIIERLGDK